PLLLPARSPNLNAFAERFVESVKAECLDRIVPLGETHLRAAVRTFADHYHEERPHRGLGNGLIAPKATSLGPGPVRCRGRLSGLLNFYSGEAAKARGFFCTREDLACGEGRGVLLSSSHQPAEKEGAGGLSQQARFLYKTPP